MRLEQDTQNKVDQAEGLLRRLDKINKFQNKYDALPAQVASGIAEKMHNLAGFIDLIENPSNEDEVVRSELKRRMVGEANLLEHKLSGRLYDFDSVIELYGIPKEDKKSLPEWLKQNREGALDSIDSLFHSKDLDQYELPLAMDLPSVKRAAEEVAGGRQAAQVRRALEEVASQAQGRGEVARAAEAEEGAREAAQGAQAAEQPVGQLAER